MLQEKDYQYLAHALELAKEGLYTTTKNPRVGAVLVKNNKIIAEGFHKITGQEHAEIHALNNCNFNAANATCYVTLEPCSHHGKTPPCVDALIASKIARVVILSPDVNPIVANNGIAKLMANNIEVVVLDNKDPKAEALLKDAYELNKGFFCRMQKKIPFVRSKIAISMDGKIALKNGYSKWITGESARYDGHKLRARSTAIITTSKTVIADDPKLTPRFVKNFDINQPLRVILDRNLNTNPNHKVYQNSGAIVITDNLKHPKVKDFQNNKIAVYSIQNIRNLLVFLAEEYECNEVLIEAGGILNAILLQNQLIDELIIYKSAKILGQDARSMFALTLDFNTSLANNINYFKLHSTAVLDNDVKLVYRR